MNKIDYLKSMCIPVVHIYDSLYNGIRIEGTVLTVEDLSDIQKSDYNKWKDNRLIVRSFKRKEANINLPLGV